MDEKYESDIAAERLVGGLAALLDYESPPWPRGVFPPLGHWLLFPPTTPQSQLGVDGHPRRDDGRSRRMWGGSRIRFLEPIAVDAVVTRRSTILHQNVKNGRRGRITITTNLHEVSVNGRLAVREEQDIVVLPATTSATPAPEGQPCKCIPRHIRAVTLDPVALFRFSALTFNAHRIHYDRDYARLVEGYQGLVVHGPLAATLLLDHFRQTRPDLVVTEFSFRAHRPLFAGTPFDLCASGSDLWCQSAGSVAMTARIAGRPAPPAGSPR